LSFPYWSIFRNLIDGAVVSYNGKEYPLSSNKIEVIAPNIAFATRLYNHTIPNEGYILESGRVGEFETEKQLRAKGCMLHLFIHFNICMAYDHIAPGIFVLDINDHLNEKLKAIVSHLVRDTTRFDFYTVLIIHSLITEVLSGIPEQSRQTTSKDYRIVDLFGIIENSLQHNLSNEKLAAKVKLSTNTFTRLFKKEGGTPPQ
jgi:hypothetical protein